MAYRSDPEGQELEVLRSAVDFTGTQVLEVGCGDGRIMFQYAPLASLVVGFDPNFNSLVMAAENRPDNVQLFQANAEVLPLPSNKFDIALLGWSL